MRDDEQEEGKIAALLPLTVFALTSSNNDPDTVMASGPGHSDRTTPLESWEASWTPIQRRVPGRKLSHVECWRWNMRMRLGNLNGLKAMVETLRHDEGRLTVDM